MKIIKLINFLKYFPKYKSSTTQKKVFFGLSAVYAPWQIFHVVILTRAMNKFGYKVDYFVGNNQDEMESIISFNANKILKINKIKIMFKYIFKIILYNFKFLKYYKDIDKVFNLEIDDVYIGDYIYDEYNRIQNKPIISGVDFKYIMAINKAIIFYLYYNDIFKSSSYEYAFTSHCWYIRFGLLGRVASKNNIKPLVYNSAANANCGIGLTKLYPENNLSRYSGWVDKNFLDNYIHNRYILDISSNYFDNIMSGVIDSVDKRNFENSKVNSSIVSINNIISLKDSGKKVVVIAAHSLVDNVTDMNGKNQLYRDYYIWLYETLKMCNNNKNIITFLKLHPSEKDFNYYPKGQDIYNSMTLDNVKIWPNDVDMKEHHELVDLIITVNGSATIEFPCFGIPVIAASHSSASTGLGTIIEVCKKIIMRKCLLMLIL